jgi:uncharacterized protein (DUF58 family)
MNHIKKILTKFSITTDKKSLHLLEGEYKSLVKGKSLDFDNLRNYTYGDDVRDIDWKATARSNEPLVKNYTSNRRHNIVFIADNSQRFAALSPDFTQKKELAADVIGILGFLAIKHNDNVQLVTWNSKMKPAITLSGNTEQHLNELITTYLKSSYPTPEITQLLKSSVKKITDRSILIVVSDNLNTSKSLRKVIQVLKNKHDLIWVNIDDINPLTIPSNYSVKDIETHVRIPASIRNDTKLIEETDKEREQRQQVFTNFLRTMKTSYTHITHEKTVIERLLLLLKQRTNESKR